MSEATLRDAGGGTCADRGLRLRLARGPTTPTPTRSRCAGGAARRAGPVRAPAWWPTRSATRALPLRRVRADGHHPRGHAARPQRVRGRPRRALDDRALPRGRALARGGDGPRSRRARDAAALVPRRLRPRGRGTPVGEVTTGAGRARDDGRRPPGLRRGLPPRRRAPPTVGRARRCGTTRSRCTTGTTHPNDDREAWVRVLAFRALSHARREPLPWVERLLDHGGAFRPRPRAAARGPRSSRRRVRPARARRSLAPALRGTHARPSRDRAAAALLRGRPRRGYTVHPGERPSGLHETPVTHRSATPSPRGHGRRPARSPRGSPAGVPSPWVAHRAAGYEPRRTRPRSVTRSRPTDPRLDTRLRPTPARRDDHVPPHACCSILGLDVRSAHRQRPARGGRGGGGARRAVDPLRGWTSSRWSRASPCSRTAIA